MIPISCNCSDTGHCPNSTCIANDGAPCYRYDEVQYDEDDQRNFITTTYGCFQSPSHGGNLLQCKGHLVPHASLKDIQCCYGKEMCNNELPLRIGITASIHLPLFPASFELLGADTIIAVSLFVCSVILAGVLGTYIYQRRKQFNFKYCYQPASDDQLSMCNTDYLPAPPKLDVTSSIDDTNISDMYMGRRTIAHEVELREEIGRGRFGHVHLSVWRGELVAVKIFSMADQPSFDRERDIYETVFLRHENILGYVSSDLKDMNGYVSMLLVTDYCSCGSLHKFLSRTAIDMAEAISLARSAAAGLDYLHNSLFGTDYKTKPSIAHRDIKSNNILVKPNFVCVIADFGLAVKFQNGKLNTTTNPREGTARYMPPELLALLHRDSKHADDKLSFELYKQGDMYSFSLVMWEILNRCHIENWASDYKLPYDGMVGNDPRVGHMYDVVCVAKKRPPIADAWVSHAKAGELTRLIFECWAAAPEARLTSRYVKTRLTEISEPLTRRGEV